MPVVLIPYRFCNELATTHRMRPEKLLNSPSSGWRLRQTCPDGTISSDETVIGVFSYFPSKCNNNTKLRDKLQQLRNTELVSPRIELHKTKASGL